MPFTEQQFFDVFGRYNEAAWPAQLGLYGAAIAALVLAWRDRRNSKYVAAMLAFLWAWMALAYHAAFFGEISSAAGFFAVAFLVEAALFVWYGVIEQRLTFSPTPGIWRMLGSLLIVYSLLLYPLLAWASGQHYPQVPTFGLPCPTVIFTFGVLMWARPSLPRIMWLVPALWAVVGTQAALFLGVKEDWGLPVAAVLALSSVYAQRNFERLHAHSVLERFIQHPDMESVHEVVIRAPADLVMETARNFDLQSVLLVRALFWLRGKLLRSSSAPHEFQGLVNEMKALGWSELAESPGRELVMGSVTQPWHADVKFVPLSPARFTSYADPGYVKIAWTLEAEPLNDARCRFRTQTRAVATDPAGRRKFKRYWSIFGAGAILIRFVVLRALRRNAQRRFREIGAHALHAH